MKMNNKQEKERRDLAHKSMVGVLTFRERFYRAVTSLLKKYNLTEPKYNVLRILRGAGSDGLPTLEISNRMITHIPDITRLLDRLESDSLVTRERSINDRRVVTAKVTSKGLKLLSKIDEPISNLHLEYTSSLNDKELKNFVELIKKFPARRN
jgi:DNA-binding MarR family transcriptional regulator